MIREIDPKDGGPKIAIEVDFLMPRDIILDKNKPAIIEDFAVIRADGADVALQFQKLISIEGPMPQGGTNRVEIAVASIPALLAMKGYAIGQRLKEKDAYDIYFCVRNFPEGTEALALECLPLLDLPTAVKGYELLASKFENPEAFGPTCVRKFVEETAILGERTPDQWQQDAFGQVNAWLRALGFAK